jgi:hypothetical protein
VKYWGARNIALGYDLRESAGKLLAQGYAPDGKPGNWGINFIGPLGTDSTLFSADGFSYNFIDGDITVPGTNLIIVTYRVKHMDLSAKNPSESSFWGDYCQLIEYEPNAGYEVYHLTY